LTPEQDSILFQHYSQFSGFQAIIPIEQDRIVNFATRREAEFVTQFDIGFDETTTWQTAAYRMVYTKRVKLSIHNKPSANTTFFRYMK
jgi:hypothetical protein